MKGEKERSPLNSERLRGNHDLRDPRRLVAIFLIVSLASSIANPLDLTMPFPVFWEHIIANFFSIGLTH